MKLLLVMCATECLEDIRDILREHHIQAYTELPDLLGAGVSGGRLGTRAFPGTSSILMTILSSEAAEELTGALRRLEERPGVGGCMRVFALPAEAVI